MSQTPYKLTSEAAQYLRLKPNTLEQWRIRGLGPQYSKVGSRVLYRTCDLERFVAAGQRQSTSDPGLMPSSPE